MRNSIFRPGTAFLLVQIIRTGTFFLASLGLARLSYGSSEPALWESWILFTATFSFFWITGALDGMVPLFKSASISEQKALSSIVFRCGIVLSAISAILVSIFTPSKDFAWHIRPAFGLLTFFNFSVYFGFYHFFLNEKGKELLLFAGSWFLTLLCCLLLPILSGFSIEVSLWVLTLASALFFCIVAFSIPKSQETNRRTIFKSWTRLAIPIALATLVGSLGFYFTGMLARANLNQVDFLRYTWGAKEFPLIILVANAFSAVISGEYASTLPMGKSGETLNKIRIRSTKMAHYFFPLCALLLIFSQSVFEIFGKNYEGAFQVFDIYLLLVIPRLVFPQIVLRGMQDTRPLLWAASAELALNILLALLFMEWWGIQGLALSTFIAFCFERIILVMVTQRKYGISFFQYSSPVFIMYSLLFIFLVIAKTFWFS